MPRTTSLAKYLFTRLRQQGVETAFGVPGDFTLKALDHLNESGLKWVGNCNELNAGYAADGYARVRPLSAVFTTYGVGELSALNAIAGSYAEGVPVCHVAGGPQRHLLKSGAKVHHTLGDGRSRIFAEIYEKVTVAQAKLVDINIKDAPEVIDKTIEQCLIQSRPAYVELPCDMVREEVPLERLEQPLSTSPTSVNEAEESKQVEKLLQRLYTSKQPLLLVDRSDGIFAVKDEVEAFVKASGIPTLAMPSGNSIIDHSIPNYYGVHAGPIGQIDTMPYLESSDLVIAFGPMFSDTQTIGWKVVPDPSKTITIGKNHIHHPSSKRETAVDAKRFLNTLFSHLDHARLPKPDTSSLGDFRSISAPSNLKPDSQIDQTSLYLRLTPYLRPNDIVILGNATPILGGRDFVLPSESCSLIASGMWFSIGQMLPCALGTALAQRDRGVHGRTVLFMGDGGFQVTVQELSTIIREKLDMTIFVVNNGGYAYERQIHGMNAEYNDIADWKYLELPRVFGADSEALKGDYSVDTFRVETWSDLDRFLADEKMNNGKGLKMVDLVVGKYDIPEKFKQVFKAAGDKL